MFDSFGIRQKLIFIDTIRHKTKVTGVKKTKPYETRKLKKPGYIQIGFYFSLRLKLCIYGYAERPAAYESMIILTVQSFPELLF